MHAPEGAFPGHQLGEATVLDDPAVVENEEVIGPHDRREPVRDSPNQPQPLKYNTVTPQGIPIII